MRLSERYPLLYHVAHKDSLSSILKSGLLSTQRLVSLFEQSQETQVELTSRLRPESVTISHPSLGSAVIRDQKPMKLKALQQCLTDLTPKEWLKLLNSMVFLWPTVARRDSFLSARSYRFQEHIVLTIDTAKVEERYSSRMRVSKINSGATLYVPPKRGSDTFRELSEHSKLREIAEVAIEGGLQNVHELLRKVHLYRGPKKVRTVKVNDVL